jgi:ribonuclease J
MVFPDGLLVTIDQIKEMPLDRVVILTTGSQGEPLSALSRIANDEHKQIKIVPGDTVIISATPIPGNERSVSNTINALFMRGADVIYGRDAGVHVSGHACQEEQKLMINLCQPKYFMPIHGEYRMLVRHAELAVECGVEPDNTFVMENGEVLEISSKGGQKIGQVKSGIILIDSSRAWNINEQIIQERRHLSEDGLITISIALNGDHSVAEAFDISMKGLILPGNIVAEELVAHIKKEVCAVLRNENATLGHLPTRDLQSYLQGVLNRLFVDKLRAQPYLQLILHEVTEEYSAAPPKISGKTILNP